MLAAKQRAMEDAAAEKKAKQEADEERKESARDAAKVVCKCSPIEAKLTTALTKAIATQVPRHVQQEAKTAHVLLDEARKVADGSDKVSSTMEYVDDKAAPQSYAYVHV